MSKASHISLTAVKFCKKPTKNCPRLPELKQATDSLVQAAKRNSKILGLFLFGTERVAEFVQRGFTFISIGNDLHHVMTQAQTHMKTLQNMPAKAGEGVPVVHAPVAPTKKPSSSAGTQKTRVKVQDLEEDRSNVTIAAVAAGVVALIALAVWKNRKA